MTDDSHIHFPIEGQSPWVMILRIMFMGMIGAVVVITASLNILIPHFAKDGMLPVVLWGITGFLILEYLAVLYLIVPRISHYARFRVYQTKVEFYPLTAFGLRISDRAESVNMGSFSGLTVQPLANDNRRTDRVSYGVYLLSHDKGRTLRLLTNLSRSEAEQQVRELSERLSLGVITAPKPEKSAQKRAA